MYYNTPSPFTIFTQLPVSPFHIKRNQQPSNPTPLFFSSSTTQNCLIFSIPLRACFHYNYTTTHSPLHIERDRMGNCQANDAAAAVIQHPDGSILRLYWPTTAHEVMKNYPGHYVAQVTLCITNGGSRREGDNPVSRANFRFTRVRLLRHKDLLLIGHVYRLITSQEVTEALKARKNARINKVHDEMGTKERQQQQQQSSSAQNRVDTSQGKARDDSQKMDQEVKYERQRQKSSRCWQPSLQSISELGS